MTKQKLMARRRFMRLMFAALGAPLALLHSREQTAALENCYWIESGAP